MKSLKFITKQLDFLYFAIGEYMTFHALFVICILQIIAYLTKGYTSTGFWISLAVAFYSMRAEYRLLWSYEAFDSGKELKDFLIKMLPVFLTLTIFFQYLWFTHYWQFIFSGVIAVAVIYIVVGLAGFSICMTKVYDIMDGWDY